MADLNRLLIDVHSESQKIKDDLLNLLRHYDGLHTQANSAYIKERTAAGSTEGLEEFYKLVQTIRRNKEVIGAILRGISNIKSIEKFKFIEEDMPKKTPPAKVRRQRSSQTETTSENESELIDIKESEAING